MVWIGLKNHICQLITMHISNNFPIYLMFLLPTFKYWHLLEAKNMQVLCQHFHNVNAVEKKNYDGLCNSLDQDV